MIQSKNYFFKASKLSYITPKIVEFKNLEDSEVHSSDFQALETSAASLTSAASETSLASTASKAQFPPKKLPDPNVLIITCTKITNTGNFLWNGSSKIRFFTNIWHPFCWRPLRPLEVKKVSNIGYMISFVSNLLYLQKINLKTLV